MARSPPCRGHTTPPHHKLAFDACRFVRLRVHRWTLCARGARRIRSSGRHEPMDVHTGLRLVRYAHGAWGAGLSIVDPSVVCVCLAWGNRLLIPTSSCMRHLYLYLPVKVCTTTPVWCYSYRDSSHQSHTGYSCTHSDTDARTGRRASRDAPTARRPLSPTVTCGYADGYGWLRMVPLVPHGPTGGQNLPEVASR